MCSSDLGLSRSANTAIVKHQLQKELFGNKSDLILPVDGQLIQDYYAKKNDSLISIQGRGVYALTPEAAAFFDVPELASKKGIKSARIRFRIKPHMGDTGVHSFTCALKVLLENSGTKITDKKFLDKVKEYLQQPISESNNSALDEIIDQVLREELSTIDEITRYEKETGQKFDEPAQDIKEKITGHPTEYAFTMISIPKVGINPKTDYYTPAGVYFYPLTEVNYADLLGDTLPFASNQPYVGLVKLNWSDKSKWLIFDKQDHQPESKIQEVVNYFNSQGLDGNKILETAKTDGRKPWDEYSTDAKIFVLVFFAVKSTERQIRTVGDTGKINIRSLANKGERFTIFFRKILKDLGFIGLYDTGESIVHESEPEQVVCLDGSAYQTLAIYKTAEVRKQSEKRQLVGETARVFNELSKLSAEQIKSLPEEKRTFKSVSFENLNIKIPAGIKIERLALNNGCQVSFMGDVEVDTKLVITNSVIKQMPGKIKASIIEIYNTDMDALLAIPKIKIEAQEFTVIESRKDLVLPNFLCDNFVDIRTDKNLTLPDNFTVGGTLELSRCSELKTLPENMKIFGGLYLYDITQMQMPNQISVNEGIYSKHDNFDKNYKKYGQGMWFGALKRRSALKEMTDNLSEIIEQELNILMKEAWSKSERSKRKSKCSNPKGFTMKQFCKNQRTKSKKGEKTNEGLEERKLGKPSSETSLRDWFKRKGAPGKKGGWVDCNTCRDGKCKPCGRQGGEERSKYPRCRPTPSQCKGYKRRGDNLQKD